MIDFIEPFDQFSGNGITPGQLGTHWIIDPAVGVSLVTGIDGTGLGMQMTAGSSGQRVYKNLRNPSPQITLHFGIKTLAFDATQKREFIIFTDTSNNRQWGLRFDVTGHMQVIGEGGLPLATSERVFLPGIAYRCCVQADISAGTFNLSVNGVVDGHMTALTGLDLKDTDSEPNCSVFVFQTTGAGASSQTYIFDDIIVLTGELVELGPMEIGLYAPNSDVTSEFTKSTGATNYGNVDELPVNADTDYNYSSTVGQLDRFGFPTLGHPAETILSVSVLSVARKEDSATRKIRNFLTIGGTTYEGTDQDLSETYDFKWEHWRTNPATAVAFVAGDFPIQAGYKYSV